MATQQTIIQLKADAKDNVSPVLKQIEKETEKLAEHGGINLKKFAEYFSGVTGVVAAMGAAAGGVFLLTEKAIANAAEMGKLAEQAAMPVETFSKLAYAAKMSEVSIESFTVGVSHLNKSLAEAFANKNSEPGKILEVLRIKAEDANHKIRATSDVLVDLAAKFRTFQDDANKADLARALFGKSGREMIPLLNEGKEGIEELMNSTKGVTKEAADQAREYERNIRILTGSLNAIGKTVAAEVLPHLIQLTQWMIQTGKDTGWVNAIAMTTIDVMKAVAVAVDYLSTSLKALGAIIGILMTVWDDFIEMSLRKGKSAWDDYGTALKRNIEIAGHLISTLSEVGTVLGDLKSGNIADAAKEAVKATALITADLASIAANDIAYFKKTNESLSSGLKQSAANAKAAYKDAVDSIATDFEKLKKFALGRWEPSNKKATTPEQPGKVPAPGLPNANSDKAEADLMRLMELERQFKNEQLSGSEKVRAGYELEYEKRLDEIVKLKPVWEDYLRVSGEAYEAYQAKIIALNEKEFNELKKVNAEFLTATGRKFEGERELAAVWYDEKIKALRDLDLSEETFRQKSAAAWKAYQHKLTEIDKQESAAKLRLSAEYAQRGSEILGNSAEAAKAFGSKGMAAYKGFMVAKATMDTYASAVGAYNSVVGIPYVGPVLAVIAAAAAVAAGVANIARIESAGSSVAHGGIDSVPEDQTFLLKRGERVLQPEANRDLTQFLRDRNQGSFNSGGGSDVSVQLAMFGGEHAAHAWANSRQGEIWFVDMLNKNARRFVRGA